MSDGRWKTERGVCPVCFRVRNLRKDGTIPLHRRDALTPCKGVGQLPVILETEARDSGKVAASEAQEQR